MNYYPTYSHVIASVAGCTIDSSVADPTKNAAVRVIHDLTAVEAPSRSLFLFTEEAVDNLLCRFTDNVAGCAVAFHDRSHEASRLLER